MGVNVVGVQRFGDKCGTRAQGVDKSGLVPKRSTGLFDSAFEGLLQDMELLVQFGVLASIG